MELSLPTLKLLQQVLNAQQLNAGADDFIEVAAAVGAAKRELNEAIAEAIGAAKRELNEAIAELEPQPNRATRRANGERKPRKLAPAKV